MILSRPFAHGTSSSATHFPSINSLCSVIYQIPTLSFSSLKYGVYHSAVLLYDTASAGPRSSLQVTPGILFVQHCLKTFQTKCHCLSKLPLLTPAPNKILSSTPASLTTISDWISLQVATHPEPQSIIVKYIFP